MKIVVFAKQVADNTRLKPEQVGETGTLKDGVDMMINPFDEYALETALRLRDAHPGSTVTVLSLGAAGAREILKKAVAAGADEAFLLSDPVFQGSDSTATAVALAQAVKTLLPDFGVLIFGQMSLDDASGQTGPKVAELLDLPSLTSCKNAEWGGEPGGGTLRVYRETERGLEIHEMVLPGALAMMKCDYELRTANIKGVMKANKTDIPVKTVADLALEPVSVGLSGSATQVTRVWQRPAKSGGVKIDGTDAAAAARQLVDYLKEAKAL